MKCNQVSITNRDEELIGQGSNWTAQTSVAKGDCGRSRVWMICRRWPVPWLAAVVVVIASLAAPDHAIAEAPSLVVTTLEDTTADDGQTSLREAIDYANGANAGEVPIITFQIGLAGVLQLNQTLPALDTSLSIQGPGSTEITVSGSAGVVRIFTVAPAATVAISGLTLANGTTGEESFGGAIFNAGTLTLAHSTLSDNTALYGGGAVYNEGTLSVFESTFNGNYGPMGGGICHATGTLSMASSSFNNNSGFYGAAIYNYDVLTVTRSTLYQNSCFYGGGLYNDGEALVTNCTLSDNDAIYGSAIENSGNLSLESNTFTNIIGSPGSIINNGSAGRIELANNIFAGWYEGFNIKNEGGTVTSLGYNLSNDDSSVVLNHLRDQNSTDPILEPLAQNGGPTLTHALVESSPAVNRGSTSLSVDQRGVNRPVGHADDIGAFESPFINSPPTVSTPATFLKTDEDTALALPASIFEERFTDPDDDPLQKIKILSLPVNGSLRWKGTLVSENQEIERNELNDLTYVPNENYYGSDSFHWNGYDGGFFADQAASIRILIASVNDAPVLSAIGDQVAVAGGMLTFTAEASDVDGSNLKFSLEDAPEGAVIAPQRGEFSWSVPRKLSKGIHYYSARIKVTDRGEPVLSDEADVNIKVLSGILFQVAPIFQNGGVRLTYSLQNGTVQWMDNIVVSGHVRYPVSSATADRGQVSGKVVNPREGVIAVTWNSFALAPGEEATLTIELPSVPPRKEIANHWKAAYHNGRNKGVVQSNNVKAP